MNSKLEPIGRARRLFDAQLPVDLAGEQVEIDSRPSDAIALAVRVSVPIFVAETVMDKASREPDEDIEKEAAHEGEGGEKLDEKRLSAFADFVDTLDLDDLEDSSDD